jgi:hypothetical protein
MSHHHIEITTGTHRVAYLPSLSKLVAVFCGHSHECSCSSPHKKHKNLFFRSFAFLILKVQMGNLVSIDLMKSYSCFRVKSRLETNSCLWVGDGAFSNKGCHKNTHDTWEMELRLGGCLLGTL